MQRVEIAFAPGPGVVWLREIDGRVELAPRGTGVVDAVALIDALLMPAAGAAIGPGEAARLTTADRDRLLAAIHGDCFGARIDATVRCVACGSPFDLDFLLADLVDSLHRDAAGATAIAAADGTFLLPDGTRFRLPTGEDEIALMAVAAAEPDPDAAGALAAATLLDRCVLAAERPEPDPAIVEAAMQAVAPLLDLELAATCPDCGAPQSLGFCLERYLLTALSQRRRETLHEVHRIAAGYGWSLGDILSLPRPQRRILAGLIEAERPAGRALAGGPFG